MDWKSIVGTVAPTIATALGGPLAGMAVKWLAADLLPADKAATAGEKEVEAAVLNGGPELLARIKEADHNFAVHMKQLDVDLERIKFQDTDSARTTYTATRSKMVPALSLLAVVAFVGLGVYVLWPKADPLSATALSVLMYLLGKWDGKVEQVYHFFFGTSSGSEKKTDILAQQGQGS